MFSPDLDLNQCICELGKEKNWKEFVRIENTWKEMKFSWEDGKECEGIRKVGRVGISSPLSSRNE